MTVTKLIEEIEARCLEDDALAGYPERVQLRRIVNSAEILAALRRLEKAEAVLLSLNRFSHSRSCASQRKPADECDCQRAILNTYFAEAAKETACLSPRQTKGET